MSELFVNRKEVIPLGKRVLAIVNSWSRMGKGEICGKRLESLRGEILSEYGRELDVRYTKPNGEENSAFNLAVWAVKEGYQEILAVGGDGVVNGVIHGLLSAKATIPIAIIPCGVGNDLAKGLGIPWKFEEAVKIAFGDVEKPIDVLRVTPSGEDEVSQIIANIASFGTDARVAQNIPELKKKLRNTPPQLFYVISFIKEVFLPFEYPTVTIRFSEEGEVKTIIEKITLIALCNGKRYARFLQPAPTAELDSGKFVVCLVRKIAGWMIAAKLLDFVLGTHVRDKKRIMNFTVSELEIFLPEEGIPFQIDGDISKILEGKKSCLVTVLQGAIRVKVPEAVSN